jgi:hypothetical protein
MGQLQEFIFAFVAQVSYIHNLLGSCHVHLSILL